MPDAVDPTTALGDAELGQLYAPLARFATLIVAVSGGPDSLALMVSLARWVRALGENAPHLEVVTVDHGLRPGTAEEARLVADAAAGLGLPHRTMTWIGEKPTTGIQEAAREARLHLLNTVAHAAPAPAAVVTAHHAEDQAETMLMRLARGSGVDGLSAMATERQSGAVVLSRPLLRVPKARLLATLAEAGITPVADPSNENDAFERVRWRRAMPRLQAAGLEPGMIGLSAMRVERARQALEAATDELAATIADDHAGAFADVAMEGWRHAPEDLRIRLLGRALAAFGGQAELARLSQVEAVAAALLAPKFAGATLGGCRITLRRGKILVYRETGRDRPPEIVLHPGTLATWDRRFEVGCGVAQAITVRALGEAEVTRLRGAGMDFGEMPREAIATLPSFWSQGRLVGVPHLALSTAGVDCTARFVLGLCHRPPHFSSAAAVRER